MHDKNVKYFVFNLFAAMVIGLGMMIIPAEAAVETNIRIPVEFLVFIPCANNGQGEDALFSGTLHILATTTQDKNGGFHVKFHDNPQGAVLTGQTTGDTWRATGPANEVLNLKAADTQTIVHNFRAIGPGSTPSLTEHIVSHVTVNPDGKITVDFTKFSVTCG